VLPSPHFRPEDGGDRNGEHGKRQEQQADSHTVQGSVAEDQDANRQGWKDEAEQHRAVPQRPLTGCQLLAHFSSRSFHAPTHLPHSRRKAAARGPRPADGHDHDRDSAAIPCGTRGRGKTLRRILLSVGETSAMEAGAPRPGQDRRLEADVRIDDGPRGMLGWSRSGAGIISEIQSAVRQRCVVENDGRRVLVYADTNEELDAARAAIETILGRNKIPASMRISERDSASGEWSHGAASASAPGGAHVLISTMNDVPGYEIEEVFGEVFGLTVRSRGAFPQLGAGLKSIVGGELKGMTSVLMTSRAEVTERMINSTRLKGANAVVAFRFDTSAIGDTWTEICAYGTAVWIRKLTPERSQVTPVPAQPPASA
jgi:uncharacterized protein YbjQ (UPF0145 family)